MCLCVVMLKVFFDLIGSPGRVLIQLDQFQCDVRIFGHLAVFLYTAFWSLATHIF